MQLHEWHCSPAHLLALDRQLESRADGARPSRAAADTGPGTRAPGHPGSLCARPGANEHGDEARDSDSGAARCAATCRRPAGQRYGPAAGPRFPVARPAPPRPAPPPVLLLRLRWLRAPCASSDPRPVARTDPEPEPGVRGPGGGTRAWRRRRGPGCRSLAGTVARHCPPPPPSLCGGALSNPALHRAMLPRPASAPGRAAARPPAPPAAASAPRRAVRTCIEPDAVFRAETPQPVFSASAVFVAAESLCKCVTPLCARTRKARQDARPGCRGRCARPRARAQHRARAHPGGGSFSQPKCSKTSGRFAAKFGGSHGRRAAVAVAAADGLWVSRAPIPSRALNFPTVSSHWWRVALDRYAPESAALLNWPPLARADKYGYIQTR